jgi:hypothetical protein
MKRQADQCDANGNREESTGLPDRPSTDCGRTNMEQYISI